MLSRDHLLRNNSLPFFGFRILTSIVAFFGIATRKKMLDDPEKAMLKPVEIKLLNCDTPESNQLWQTRRDTCSLGMCQPART